MINKIRDNFKNYVGKVVSCYGTVIEFGKVLVDKHTDTPYFKLTLLLDNIHFVDDGKVVISNHVWINVNYHEMKLNLKLGDIITFNAEVCEYTYKTGVINYTLNKIKNPQIYIESKLELKDTSLKCNTILDFYIMIQKTGKRLDYRYVIPVGRLKAKDDKYFKKVVLTEEQRHEIERLFLIFVIKNNEPVDADLKWLRALLESGLDLCSLYHNQITPDCKKLVYEALSKKTN